MAAIDCEYNPEETFIPLETAAIKSIMVYISVRQLRQAI